jgi:hypothetical protein
VKFQHFFSLISSFILIANYPSAVRAGDIKRDYDFSTPLPHTERVTIRQPIQALPTNLLFTRCLQGSHLVEFAESTNYRVMICRDDSNKLKKYWIQQTKETGAIIQATAEDNPKSQPARWTVGNFDEVGIYADSARPEKSNAYIEFYNKETQEGWAEALLYHYSESYNRP